MMNKKKVRIAIISLLGLTILLLGFTIVNFYQRQSTQQMIDMLGELSKRNTSVANPFNPEAKYAQVDSILKLPLVGSTTYIQAEKASLALKVGKEEEAVKIYERLVKQMDFMSVDEMMPNMAIAYMRLGERSNCMLNHNGSSCIFPIKDGGVHLVKTGSKKAIGVYESILKSHPDDLESKWLLNVAFMTLGGYPKDVPAQFLIPGLDAQGSVTVKPFTDIAASLGLDIN
jgi:hypothetical protein